MKNVFYLILMLNIFSACKTGKNSQNPSGGPKTFIPHEVGNYWVYESSQENYMDTLKVIGHEKSADGLKVNLNTEKWLIKSPDSIFVRCNTRGGGEFTMPLYIRNANSEYGTCMGDVVTQVEAKKLSGPISVKGKAYINCTEYFIKPYKKVIVAEGIGVIKYSYLDIDGSLQSERQLVSFKLK